MINADMAEQADATDLKSVVHWNVRVQVPLSALSKRGAIGRRGGLKLRWLFDR